MTQQSTLYWFLLHYASTLLAHDAGDGSAPVEHQALSIGESLALSHIPPKPDQLDILRCYFVYCQKQGLLKPNTWLKKIASVLKEI